MTAWRATTTVARFGWIARLVWVVAGLLAGCTTLPPSAARALEHAIADNASTALGRVASAAGRGVRVRLLVDDFYAGGEGAVFAALAALPNVEVRIFNPLPVRTGSALLRLLFSRHEFDRVNHRMHNKLFIADGAFAVTGGRNIADEYFMTSGVANFIDLDVVSSGPAVRALAASFDAFWNSQHVYTAAELYATAADPNAVLAAQLPLADPQIAAYATDPLGQTPFQHQLSEGRVALTFAPAQVFADGPDKVDEPDRVTPSVMMLSTLGVIGAARREVLLVSPYFIPGDEGMARMRSASAAGVRIVLVTNGRGATDEPLVHLRYADYRREMLELGVEIHEISPSLASRSGAFGDFGGSFARLHAKSAVIDGRYLYVGSMNLDGRSAVGNTEIGLVIDSPELATGIARLVSGERRRRNMYRLQLAADGDAIEWVSTDAQGREAASRDEPDGDWWRRIRTWLVSPFVAEALL